MKAIFACKMYKASKNKSKIKAALADPLNVELVQQLKSYLDEDVQDILVEQKEERKLRDSDKCIEKEDDMNSESDEGVITDDKSPSSANKGADKPSDDAKHADGDMADIPDSTGGEIEESTDIKADHVDIESIADMVDSIKSDLNSNLDTAGVSRITVKGDEIWIHYNDNINLNNVMEPVISMMNKDNYTDMKFNRLARTENAIVFLLSSIRNAGDSNDE